MKLIDVCFYLSIYDHHYGLVLLTAAKKMGNVVYNLHGRWELQVAAFCPMSNLSSVGPFCRTLFYRI